MASKKVKKPSTGSAKAAIKTRLKSESKGGVSSKSVLREDCFRVLNEKNQADPKVEPKIEKALLLKMYRNMLLTRRFDERGMMLQRQGRIGFYVPSFGQEAIQTGTAAALTLEDWVFPSYREPGIFIYRGASLFHLLCNLYGNRSDVCKGRQMPVHYSFADLKLFSVSSPISTQVVQAVGAAMAAKIKKTKEIAISYFGDGGTSENDFHTGMTFAGAFKAPAIFVCTNNQFAISCPLSKQNGTPRLFEKAVGYGMPGIAVDGNDILAVYSATKQAVERARAGKGPSLIECVTFRMGPHSSSDDPSRYRDEKEYEAWKKRDPIDRFRDYLFAKKFWNAEQDKELEEELKAQILEAIEQAEKEPPPEIEDIFSDVFATMTPQLEKQRQSLQTESELRGKFENTSEAFPL